MTLTTLAQGEAWMAPQEHDFNRELIRAIATFLEAADVPQNALVALRVNDVASTWLLARRLESALAPADGDPAPCPKPTQADAIGKCRERLRRAVKELEDYCAKTGTPAPRGLVEQMHLAVQQVKAASILDKNNNVVNPVGHNESENQAPETPASPNPENNPTETPDPSPENNPTETPLSPKPLGNVPETPHRPNPENNAPRERRQTGSKSDDKNRTTQTSRTAPGTRNPNYAAIFIPSVPPGPQPPQDTG